MKIYRDRPLTAWKGCTASRMWLSGIAGMLGLVGLLCLMGCSGENDNTTTPEVTLETAISFSSELASTESVTRAASVSGLEKYKTEFRVWCYKEMTSVVRVMDDYVVRWTANTAKTTATNTNDWEYVDDGQPIRYWDWGVSAYRFFGLVDATSSVKWTSVASVDSRAFSSAVDATSENIPYYTKLWYSTGNEAVYPNKRFGQPVQLEFLQPLSRVRFYFVKTDPDMEVSVQNKSFKPTTSGNKIARKGTFTVTYPTSGATTAESWNVVPLADGALEAFTDDFYESDNANNDTGREHWYTVLPATGQGTYTLEVTVNGLVKTAVVPETYMKWEPNYEYTYIFKITEAGGVELETVQSAFKEWTDGGSGEHSIYNW